MLKTASERNADAEFIEVPYVGIFRAGDAFGMPSVAGADNE